MLTVAHPLSGAEAARIDRALAAQGLNVLTCADETGLVHIYPDGPMSTRDEVRVLAAHLAVTDARLAWHPAVTR